MNTENIDDTFNRYYKSSSEITMEIENISISEIHFDMEKKSLTLKGIKLNLKAFITLTVAVTVVSSLLIYLLYG